MSAVCCVGWRFAYPTYAALCIVVFKVFRIPLNKWTV
ncbi:hypothetical protein, partial [Klebsiella pneumoniae]